MTLLSVLITLSVFGFSQTQRMVLWEEFTSGSCGPCASVNPQMTSYWNNNPDVVVGIQYHMSWPASNDPMYLNNPSDNDSRRGIYGVNSIPFAAIDGNRYADNVGSVQSLINIVQDAYDNDPSSFDLQLQYELNDSEDQLTVTAMITATEEVSDLNSRLYLPVIEKHIHLSSPQPNGEQDFYNVLKALVPSSSGTSLPSDWEVNDYMIFQYTWDVYGFYDIDEVGLIGFIQNTGSTKEVNQAAYGSSTAISPNYANDAAVLEIKTPQVLCNNSVSPTVTIRNQGSDVMTSATIHYSINDEDYQVYEWSGSLGFLESAIIDLPEISYSVAGSYSINVSVIDPNNTTDEYVKNNTMTTLIYQSAYLPQNCKVAILTDDHPEETTWDIKNSGGEIIVSGGPYSFSSIFIEDFTWTSNDCFTFSIYDAGGNGMDGGFYKIVNSSTQVIWVGDNDFGSVATAEFAYDEVMSISEMPIGKEVNIYPNPINESAQIEFTLLEQSNVSVGLFDLLGKKLISVYNGTMAAGSQNLVLHTDQLETGVYFVNIEVNGNITSKKVSVNK